MTYPPSIILHPCPPGNAKAQQDTAPPPQSNTGGSVNTIVSDIYDAYAHRLDPNYWADGPFFDDHISYMPFISLIEFCSKFAVTPPKGPNAGKIAFRRSGAKLKGMVFYPQYSSDPNFHGGRDYGQYCRFALVRYRPWVDAPFGREQNGNEHTPRDEECIRQWKGHLAEMKERVHLIYNVLLPEELKSCDAGIDFNAFSLVERGTEDVPGESLNYSDSCSEEEQVQKSNEKDMGESSTCIRIPSDMEEVSSHASNVSEMTPHSHVSTDSSSDSTSARNIWHDGDCLTTNKETSPKAIGADQTTEDRNSLRNELHASQSIEYEPPKGIDEMLSLSEKLERLLKGNIEACSADPGRSGVDDLDQLPDGAVATITEQSFPETKKTQQESSLRSKSFQPIGDSSPIWNSSPTVTDEMLDLSESLERLLKENVDACYADPVRSGQVPNSTVAHELSPIIRRNVGNPIVDHENCSSISSVSNFIQSSWDETSFGAGSANDSIIFNDSISQPSWQPSVSTAPTDSGECVVAFQDEAIITEKKVDTTALTEATDIAQESSWETFYDFHSRNDFESSDAFNASRSSFMTPPSLPPRKLEPNQRDLAHTYFSCRSPDRKSFAKALLDRASEIVEKVEISDRVKRQYIGDVSKMYKKLQDDPVVHPIDLDPHEAHAFGFTERSCDDASNLFGPAAFFASFSKSHNEEKHLLARK